MDCRSGLSTLTTGMASPTRRLRSGAVRGEDGGVYVDQLVEAVVARLTGAGLVVAAAATADVKEEVLEALDDSLGPTPAQRKLWIAELRRQLETSVNYGIREKEEARGLLIIGEGAGPPPDQFGWYWGRVRLFLIIAHQGWAAALRDARTSDMDRLGIHLSPAAAQPAAAPRPAAAPPDGGRGRGSRPSGLRPLPGGAAPAAASQRKN